VISLSGAIQVVIQLVVVGIVFFLLNWLVDSAPMEARIKQIAKFILVALAVLVLIGMLISFGGGGPIFRQ
jgi:glucan phosphoethanolaminetransferase (alkaline phosphatase superfamily)